MDPFLGGGHMIERVYRDHATWADPPAKFEAGTMPIVQIIGLGAAIDFVESIGFEAIHQHEHDLLQYAEQRLAQLPGIKIYGPSIEQKGAIISFTIDGLPAEDLAWRLDGAGICTRHGHHCTMPLHDWLGVPATTRASFGIYNNKADVDALYDAISVACRERGIA
jgi:cysteine desulfurase/selenocysteine lyase